MKPKLLIVYITLIFLPLAILGWLGVRAVAQEREMLDRSIQGLLAEQLVVYDKQIQALLTAWTQEWKSRNWDAESADAIRQHLARDGRITQYFRVDEDGMLLYPHINEELTSREQTFLERTEMVWSSGAIHPNQLVESDIQLRNQTILSTGIDPPPVQSPEQWYEWYWGDGLQLLYWWPSDWGDLHGLELDRVRLLAEIIGELPDTPDNLDGQVVGTRLLDESGHLLYQWGDIDNDAQSLPKVSVPLSAPLGAWSLQAYMAVPPGASTGNVFLLAMSLTCLALVMIGLGIYFYRENTRELREAAQRVNFVNHVSHELKTPLTNIRMYAELLQEQMNPEQEQEASRLSVILSESQRLSRLITNVLTFNRNQRSALTLHPTLVSVDERIRQILMHFEKSFAQHGITINLDCAVSDEVRIDADILEQILGNLLSNVEKYARNSGELHIDVLKTHDQLEITVKDNGPGIPPAERNAIFSPFYRIDNDLTEGVSGTGIGLSIARDLAKLHGGDLELLPSETGAHFRIRLAIQGGSR